MAEPPDNYVILRGRSRRHNYGMGYRWLSSPVFIAHNEENTGIPLGGQKTFPCMFNN